VVRCRASRAEVWTHVSNTVRLNRAVRASPLTVEENPSRGLERFQVRGVMGGFDVTYLERPFAWENGQFFSFYRVMLTGPARAIAARYDLSDRPDGAGCDVTVRVEVTPRFSVLRPLISLATRRTIKSLQKYILSVDDGAKAPPASPTDVSSLQAARARIRARHAPELVARLVEHVQSGDDLELAPIRPFALASEWAVDRNALLRLCLEAVPAGMLELRWGLLCPSCRTASQVLPSLRDLDGKAHCHACDIRYDTDLDSAVEAQFFPHPSVRRVETRPYCIGGPALTPHVVAQLPLDVDGAGTIHAPGTLGRVRLFVRGGATALIDVAQDAPTSASVTILASALTPTHVAIAPRGSLQVVNRSGEARHAKLERVEWMTHAATAHHVATMPEFRPLFGAEALRPGLALKVSNVAILFSDLCGSTALYSRIGDAPAFGIVTDCLAYGVAIVENHCGAVVKTIGDAVMAAFVDARAAVAAGVEMLARWEEFAETRRGAGALALKVGVYAGPCTIVTANDAIDYFGQTVNSAARVQHLAGPHEAVIADSLLDAVPQGSVELVERFDARVKGIDDPLRVARLRTRAGVTRVAPPS
jgi:adenylate cyclase